MGYAGTQLEIAFQSASKRQSYRSIVLTVINERNEPMTARQIAQSSGLTYSQTIFALNALYNLGKINRIGRKFTARWIKRSNEPAATHGLLALERFFLGIR